MNNRRKLVLVLSTAASLPHVVVAQTKKAPIVIGWLNIESQKELGHYLTAFKTGMESRGWKYGADYIIEERWAEGRRERLEALALDLARKSPAVIVSAPGNAVRAAVKSAPTVPIVQASGWGPVASGFAKSFAKPGGMVTGVTNFGEVSNKFLEILLDAVPTAHRIGVFVDSSDRTGVSYRESIDTIRRWTKVFRVETVVSEIDAIDQISDAIARLARDRVQALVVMPSSTFPSAYQTIVDAALKHRWPTVTDRDEFAEAGALLSYGVDREQLYRRAAYYVDRILKGARPADLPIEQPTKFELVVNLKTAKALGITIPQTVMVRADRVIQ
jgi:putative ABC transport system substrate-binding protein